jgi:uncharacterized membrane protein
MATAVFGSRIRAYAGLSWGESVAYQSSGVLPSELQVRAVAKLKQSPRRHLAFYVSAAAGVLAALAIGLWQQATAATADAVLFSLGFALPVGVDIFFAVYLVITAALLPRLTAEFLRKHAAEEDAPAPFILFVTLAAVAVSAVSLFMVLHADNPDALLLILSIASVVLGWFAVHTMWAMHYAYEYYERPEASPGKGKASPVVGGLEFPGGDEPDGLASLYFSYAIGMTAQTSDTEVTSNKMRRLVVVHGVLSFFFNTIIVAAAVNIVVSLG